MSPSSSKRTKKLLNSNDDEPGSTESAVCELAPVEDCTETAGTPEPKRLSRVPPRRPKPRRCLLYPICIARPCRLSSHQQYARQNTSVLSRQECAARDVRLIEAWSQKPKIRLASIENPRTDPFIQYPFDLTTEMQELVHFSQSPSYSYVLVAWLVGEVVDLPFRVSSIARRAQTEPL